MSNNLKDFFSLIIHPMLLLFLILIKENLAELVIFQLYLEHDSVPFKLCKFVFWGVGVGKGEHT